MLLSLNEHTVAEDLEKKWLDSVKRKYLESLWENPQFINKFGDTLVEISRDKAPTLDDIKESAIKFKIGTDELFLLWLSHYEYYCEYETHKDLKEYNSKINVRILC